MTLLPPRKPSSPPLDPVFRRDLLSFRERRDVSFSLDRRIQSLAQDMLYERAQGELTRDVVDTSRFMGTEMFSELVGFDMQLLRFPEIDMRRLMKDMKPSGKKENRNFRERRFLGAQIVRGQLTQYIQDTSWTYPVRIHLPEKNEEHLDLLLEMKKIDSKSGVSREYVLGVCRRRLNRLVQLSSAMVSRGDAFYLSGFAEGAYQQLEKTSGDISRSSALMLANVREEIAVIASARRSQKKPYGSIERTK